VKITDAIRKIPATLVDLVVLGLEVAPIFIGYSVNLSINGLLLSFTFPCKIN
jgi:hypothetical protein